MRKRLWYVAAACGVVGLWGCEGVLEVRTPQCRTPVPVFDYRPTLADSVSLLCPYAYVNADGDTVMVTTELPDLPEGP